MKTKTFEYIWNEVIEKCIYCIEAKVSDLSKQSAIDYDFRIRNLEQSKRNIFLSYNKTKNHLKSTYYNASGNNKEAVNRIDNHKIAACLCSSLLQNKVFTFRLDTDIPTEIFCSNYELAYMVSLGTIYALLIAQYKDVGREDFAEKLQQQKTLLVPPTSIGHDSYHVGRIHTLALNDVYGNEFDILTYSDMMFWIEYYNRQILEGTLNPMSLLIEKPEIDKEEK